MEHIFTVVIEYYNIHQTAILGLIGGSAGLSVAIQWFLHKFKVNGAKLAFIISHLFAAATAAAAFLLDSVHPNAGITYTWLWFIAQFWHRFAVNPAYNKYVIPFLDWLAKQNAKQPALADPIAADNNQLLRPDTDLE